MDDLIRRQDVLDIIMGDGLYCDTYDDKEYSAEKIKSIPTADLSEYCDKLWKTAYERGKAEAHPKKGKWENSGEWEEHGTVRYCCSQCGCDDWHFPLSKISYCWNCGARMEESDG